MGLFKNLFVEEISGKTEATETDIHQYEDSVDIEAELEKVIVETLIEDIYSQNNLIDKSKSIFKVEELIDSLPKEMVTETKKTSVLAILGSFGLTATYVNIDGETRIDVLNNILAKIIEDSKSEISGKESNIEDHKREIARLEKEVSDKLEETKVSEKSINEEISRITELLKFIGGVE